MSTTIADVSTFGDVKGRDNYMRNLFHSVKGDGSTASSLVQGFYGIPSTTSTEAEFARITVSEGAVDDAIARMTFGLSDGSALVDSAYVNSVGLNASILQKNDLATGARILLEDDALEPSVSFVLGDLSATPSTPLVILSLIHI